MASPLMEQFAHAIESESLADRADASTIGFIADRRPISWSACIAVIAFATADEGMTTLTSNHGQLTLIYTYAVKPELAEELVEMPVPCDARDTASY